MLLFPFVNVVIAFYAKKIICLGYSPFTLLFNTSLLTLIVLVFYLILHDILKTVYISEYKSLFLNHSFEPKYFLSLKQLFQHMLYYPFQVTRKQLKHMSLDILLTRMLGPVLYFWSLKYISIFGAILVLRFTPIHSYAMSLELGLEESSFRRFFGILLIIVSFSFLILEYYDLGIDPLNFAGLGLAYLAACFYGLGIIVKKKIPYSLDVRIVSFWMALVPVPFFRIFFWDGSDFL